MLASDPDSDQLAWTATGLPDGRAFRVDNEQLVDTYY